MRPPPANVGSATGLGPGPAGHRAATTALALLHQVAVAQGFVWALEVAELLSYAQTTALHALINQAERAAFPRLAGGDLCASVSARRSVTGLMTGWEPGARAGPWTA